MSVRISRTNLLFAGIMIGCAALLVFVVLVDKKGGLEYTYTFQDAKDLPVGAPVKMNGVQIGEVTGVQLNDSGVEVGVRIYAEHRTRIFAPPNSAGRIKKDSVVLGNAYLEVLNRPGVANATRIQSGTRTNGLESWTEEKLWTGGGELSVAATRMLESGREHFDRLESWAVEGGGKELADRTKAWLDNFEGSASEKAGEYRIKMAEQLARGAELLQSAKENPKAQEVTGDIKAALDKLLVQAKQLETTATLKLEKGQEAVEDLVENPEAQDTVKDVEATLQRLLDEGTELEADTRVRLESLLGELKKTDSETADSPTADSNR